MILLTTPFDPGDVDPGALYTHVQIADMAKNPTAQYLRVKWIYGTVDGGSFVPGALRPTTTVFVGEDFTNYAAIIVDGDTTCDAAFDRAVEQALIDRGILTGSIV